ncbi:hypothetical protein K7W42_07565 [Deinococcus sp. HMF7604]|uniref:hypothetical protein n=1 Tax=Deinococcus betulae TaxID=2873312 RepID=UPI001CCBD342|nr:hypothetical protein [Deinococcus betulae]MBZ9750716.1 hypothetical protein [Deinococcus betulae]
MTGRMNGVTWAVLDVYAQTLEGQSVEGLRKHLRRAAPLKRQQNTARVTAAGLGALDERGTLTPQGLTAARAAVNRLRAGPHWGQP